MIHVMNRLGEDRASAPFAACLVDCDNIAAGQASHVYHRDCTLVLLPFHRRGWHCRVCEFGAVLPGAAL